MISTFKRFLTAGVEVVIGTPPLQGISVRNLDSSGLLIEWEVMLTNTSSSDSAKVRIVNLDELEQIPILEKLAGRIGAFGVTGTISFGWEGLVFECFTGKISRIIPKIPTGVDYVSEIEFNSMAGRTLNAPSLGYELDQALWSAAFDALAASMGFSLSPQFYTALAANPVATTNTTVKAAFGDSPKSDMDTLVSSLGAGYTWTVIGNQIYLLNQGLFQDRTPPQILSAESGLLNWSPLDEGGAVADALGNPSVKPGQQILIQNNQGQLVGGAPLRVESVSFRGATNVGCTMQIVARKQKLLV